MKYYNYIIDILSYFIYSKYIYSIPNVIGINCDIILG